MKTATEVESTRPTAAVVPNATVSLIIENRVVTNRHRERLSLAASTADLRDYICRRNSWNEETFHLVDWEHFHAALETVFKASKKRFSRIVKFIHDYQNTGHKKKLFTQHLKHVPTASDKCPCCGTQEETIMHLFQCGGEKIRRKLEVGIGDLKDTLQKYHVLPKV